MTDDTLRQVLTLASLPAVPVPGPDALAGSLVLVLGGDAAIRDSIAAAVDRHGGVVTGWDDASGRPCADGSPDVIIDLGMAGVDTVTPTAWQQPMARTVAALRHVYGDWSRETDASRLHYLAVTGMGGSMGLAPAERCQPLSGLWAGLAKTLPREFPACDVRACDLGTTTDPGAALVAEMLGTRLLEVGVADDRRWTILPRKEAVGGAPIEPHPTDVVLVTGGGRGIGFEMALDFAQRFGCHVMVSGRAALPDPEPSWLTCSDADFDRLSAVAFRNRSAGTTLPQVRRAIQQRRQAREIWANLRRARDARADISYHQCDVSDADEVAALVRKAGDGLAWVVHNAGIDVPARLPGKTTRQFLSVIDVKVNGFLHLVEALADRPLKMLCATGSLTGRYGGMVGQLDYAAANEGLARLAMWAGHRLPYPVKSLSWPTWDGLGLITNLKAAARYMTPIPVPAGVAAWRAELTHAGSGEIGFMGAIGEVSPQHLHGIVVPSDWSGRSALLTMRFQLGDLSAFAPAALLGTVHRLDHRAITCMDDVRVDTDPAVPVSLALEYLLTAATWLGPPSPDGRRPQRLEQVRIVPSALRAPSGRLTLRRRARAGWHGESWRVQVELMDEHERLAGAASVVFDEAGSAEWPVPVEGPEPAEDDDPPPPVRASGHYRWLPYLTEVGDWRRDGDGWTADVAPAEPADLFAVWEPPRPRLPFAHLEALVAVSPVRDPADPVDAAECWTADAIRLGPPGEATRIAVSASGHDGTVRDGEGRILVSVRAMARTNVL